MQKISYAFQSVRSLPSLGGMIDTKTRLSKWEVSLGRQEKSRQGRASIHWTRGQAGLLASPVPQLL